MIHHILPAARPPRPRRLEGGAVDCAVRDLAQHLIDAERVRPAASSIVTAAPRVTSRARGRAFGTNGGEDAEARPLD